MAIDPVRESFESELGRALLHLYDPAFLRRSPLLHAFSLNEREDPVLALRQLLNEAIEALKPDDDVPQQAGAWRIYRILFYRYTEQFTQREVASDLGLSVRQLRREEKSAIAVLGDYLCAHCQQSRDVDPLDLLSRVDDDGAQPNAITPSQEQELDWVERTIPHQQVDARAMIESALDTVRPLLGASGVSVDHSLPDDPVPLLANPTALRQALLHILTTAARRVPGGRITVEVEDPAPKALCRLSVAARGLRGSEITPVGAEALAMVRRLLDVSGASLEIAEGVTAHEPFRVTLRIPLAERVPVLVIEDNADTMQLLKRYLADSRYRFIGISDPQDALDLRSYPSPRVIVLDVMMPDVDGWELLARLGEHPKTRGVPVVVCTILPQETMALALGAAAFLRKPISRRDLLAVLDHLLEQPERVSH